MYRDIPNALCALIEPVVVDRGCELVDVEVRRGAGGEIVRITVDGPAGDGRVTVDCCAQLSREIETQLDAAAAIPGTYRLEVSSPGLDRMLAREKDFEAACGREVKLRTRQPVNGCRRFRGRLVGFEGGLVRMEVGGVETAIHFDEIERANAVYEFSRADFKGRAATQRRTARLENS